MTTGDRPDNSVQEGPSSTPEPPTPSRRWFAQRFEIVVPDFGPIKLRPLTYTSALEHLVTEEIPVREFEVRVIHDHLAEPGLSVEDVRAWPDTALSAVLDGWVRADQRFRAPLDPASPFDSFRAAVRTYVEEERERLSKLLRPALQGLLRYQDLYKGIHLDTYQHLLSNVSIPVIQPFRFQPPDFWAQQAANDLERQVRATTESLQRATRGLSAGLLALAQSFSTADLAAGHFITQLPDLGNTIRQFKELADRQARGEAVLEETGYGFATSLLASHLLADLAEVVETVRGAAVTNTLLAYTRDPGFEEDLRERFEASSVLRRRWRVIVRVLHAHRQRDYVLSIPPLLAQIDGMMADAFVLNGLARPVGRKLLAKDANGALKLNKWGDPVELHGLGKLVQHHNFQDHEVLRGVVEILNSSLIQDRNGILHGRRTAYGRAKLSVVALLVLEVLAIEIEAFETGKINEKAALDR